MPTPGSSLVAESCAADGTAPASRLSPCFENRNRPTRELYIPITTNERTRFVVDGEMLPMQPGDCWYANFGLTHSARNDGATEEGLPELFLRVADLLALSLDAGDLQRIHERCAYSTSRSRRHPTRP